MESKIKYLNHDLTCSRGAPGVTSFEDCFIHDGVTHSSTTHHWRETKPHCNQTHGMKASFTLIQVTSLHHTQFQLIYLLHVRGLYSIQDSFMFRAGFKHNI